MFESQARILRNLLLVGNFKAFRGFSNLLLIILSLFFVLLR